MAVTVTNLGKTSQKSAPGTLTWTALTGIALNSGDSIIVTFSGRNFDFATESVTVAWNGNNLTEIIKSVNSSSVQIGIYALHGVTGGTGSVTVTVTSWASATGVAISADQVTGLATTPNDKTATATGSSGAPNSGATATTTAANELVWGAHIMNGPTGDTDVTTNAGATGTREVTNLGTSGGSATSNFHMDVMWGTVASTGTYSHSWSGATSRGWGAVVATFKALSSIAPGGGTLALAGGTLAVLFQLGMAAAGLTMTGGTPAVQIGSTISPPGVALTASGGIPSVNITGTQLSPAAASLRFSGGSLKTQTNVGLVTGSLTLTGNSPGLQQILPTVAGRLTLSGNAVNEQLNLGPPGASLVLTGTTLTPQLQLPMVSGRLVFSTGSATLNITGGGTTLSMVGGSLSLSPGTPTVQLAVGPSQAALVVTGGTVTFQSNIGLTTGALVLTGGSPGVRVQVGMNPVAGGAVLLQSLAVGGAGPSSAIDCTGADLIIVGISWFGRRRSVSDSQGNTYTPLNVFAATNGNTEDECQLYYVKNPTTSTTQTFRVIGRFPSFFVLVFSGSQATPFDVQNGNNGGAGLTSIQPGSITPTQDNEVIVTVVGLDESITPTTGLSIDSGLSITGSIPYTNGRFEGGAMAWKQQRTAAAINPTWTLPQSGIRTAAIASFKFTTTARSDSAALVFTGGTPTVQIAQTVSPGQATLTLTGGTLTQQLQVLQQAGALTLTGGTQGVQFALAPTKAALTLTGGIATLSITGVQLSPSVASLTLTGKTPATQTNIGTVPAPLVLAGGTQVLQLLVAPTRAALVLTGGTSSVQDIISIAGTRLVFTPGTIREQFSLAPSGARLVLTRGTATVALGGLSLNPAGAALTLTGNAPTLQTIVGLTPGSLVLTGTTPSLQQVVPTVPGALTLNTGTVQVQYRIPTVSAPLVVTGTAPTTQTVVAVVPGSLVLSGTLPASQFSLGVSGASLSLGTGTLSEVFRFLLSPTGARLVFSPATPSVQISLKMRPGALTLTGGTSSLSITGVLISPTGGRFVFTGQAPTIRTNVGLNTGALVLTGTTPTVTISSGLVITPGTAVLTFTPHAVGLQLIQSAGTTGRLVLTGGTSALQFGVQTAPAALTLVGGQPRLTTIVATLPASLSISGNAPQPQYTIFPAPASLNFVSGTPVLQTSIQTASSTLRLLAGVTQIQTSVGWLNGGNIVFSGGAPSVDITVVDIDLTTGSLSLTGGTLEVQYSYFLILPGASVTFSGNTLQVNIHQANPPASIVFTDTTFRTSSVVAIGCVLPSVVGGKMGLPQATQGILNNS